jgi:hypothetical protein
MYTIALYILTVSLCTHIYVYIEMQSPTWLKTKNPITYMTDTTVAILSSGRFFPEDSLDLIRRQTELPDNKVILYNTEFPYEDFMRELCEREILRMSPLLVLADIVFAPFGSIPTFASAVSEINKEVCFYLCSASECPEEQCELVSGRVNRSSIEEISSAINAWMFAFNHWKEPEEVEVPPWVH